MRYAGAAIILFFAAATEAADVAPKASGQLDGVRVAFPEKGLAIGVKAAIGLLETCCSESLYQADEYQKALQGDHLHLVFNKPITVGVLNEKLAISELMFRLPINTGVFWVRAGDKWRRYSKYEFQKEKPFTSWLREARKAE